MKPLLGFFDSGVGGFTVLGRILRRHGEVPCVYLADNARAPYGNKSATEIRVIAEEVVHWLKDQKVSTVVTACNTTNSLAFDVVKKVAEVPVLGLIGAAVEMVNQPRVGVLATSATAASGSYRREIQAVYPASIVVEQACPAFVPLIESGRLTSEDLRLAAIDYLQPLLEAGVDEIVLGCTHYPLIEPLLRTLLPNDMRMIDPAVGLARQLDEFVGLPENPCHDKVLIGSTRFCVTSRSVGFATMAKHWLGQNPQVEVVSLRASTCLF